MRTVSVQVEASLTWTTLHCGRHGKRKRDKPKTICHTEIARQLRKLLGLRSLPVGKSVERSAAGSTIKFPATTPAWTVLNSLATSLTRHNHLAGCFLGTVCTRVIVQWLLLLHLFGPILLGCCQLQLTFLSSVIVLRPPLLCEGWGGHPLC